MELSILRTQNKIIREILDCNIYLTIKLQQSVILEEATLYKLKHLDPIKVRMTSYSPRKCETDDTPFLAAGGPVGEGTVAISNDLEMELGWKMHDHIFIPGHGIYKVNDRMNERWTRRIDVFHFDTNLARNINKETIVYHLGRL